MSDLSKQPLVILRMRNFNSCQFFYLIVFISLATAFFLMSTLRSYMHGVKHDIRGIYGVWSLLSYHSSLHFEPQYFWDGFGIFGLSFFPLYFLIGWMKGARDYQGH